MAVPDQLPGAQIPHWNPTPPPPSHSAPAPAQAPKLSSSQQSVYDLMMKTLKSWGLETLAGDLKNLIIKGDTAPELLSLELSQTDAYKKRFKGNELRKAQGLAELNPAEYIALEGQYGQVLRAYGLPNGFYDSHDDFTKLIGADLSPSELQQRAQIAHDQYMAAPGYVKDLWSQYFGTKGDALAFILDPDTATSVIGDKSAQVALGGAAAQFGFNINQKRAQQFQQSGVSLDQARQAYQQIGQNFGLDQTIAQRFGSHIGQQDEENALLLGEGDALRKRQGLINEEQALFKGASGSDANTIGVVQNR